MERCCAAFASARIRCHHPRLERAVQRAPRDEDALEAAACWMELETKSGTTREGEMTQSSSAASASPFLTSGFPSSLSASPAAFLSAMPTSPSSIAAAASSASPAVAARAASPVPAVQLAALFEARRPVRRLLPASHTVTIPIRLLNAELMCVVCLGILRQCTSVMSCLHRFCSACIQKSLRFGKKECPQCRVSCPSHRHLRPDPVFDCIIAAIYPDLERAEEAQSQQLQLMIDKANVTQFAESAMRGARKQAEQAQQRAADSRRQQEQSRREAQERRRRLESTAYFRLLPLPPHSSSALSSAPLPLVLAKDRFKSNKAVDIRMLRLFIARRLQLQHAAQSAPLTADTQQQQQSAFSSPSEPSASAFPSASSSPFPRVHVSLWMRWSDMTDLARRVWSKRRTQRRQSAQAAAGTPAAAAQPAEAAGEEPVSVTRKRRREELESEGEERSSGVVGFVCSEASERPEVVQLGGLSTLSFLYDRVWDEKRAAAAQPAAVEAQRVACGEGDSQQQQAVWKKLTLYYALQAVDDAGRPLRRSSGAEDETARRLQQAQLTHYAMEQPPASSHSPSQQQQLLLPALAVDAAQTMQDGR